MNEDMKTAWLEITEMLGEPTREELDVFLRTWQRATEAHRKALAEQPAQQCGYPYCGCNSKAWCKLERMAENARELGLDYEPAQQEPVAWRWLYNGQPDSKKHFSMPGPDAEVISRASACEFPRTVQYLYTSPQQEPVISTAHGPWIPSTHPGEEGESYCKRCLLRDKFLGSRLCEPHIVEQPAQQEPVAKDNSNYRLDPPGLDPLYTPAQRTWVGLTDEEVDEWTPEIHTVIRAIEAKLKEKNT